MKRKEVMARHRQRINAIKLERGCEDPRCAGFPLVAIALHFDHRPGSEKVASVANLVVAGASWDVIEAEIAKCDVRCANCHYIRTHETNGYGNRCSTPCWNGAPKGIPKAISAPVAVQGLLISEEAA